MGDETKGDPGPAERPAGAGKKIGTGQFSGLLTSLEATLLRFEGKATTDPDGPATPCETPDGFWVGQLVGLTEAITQIGLWPDEVGEGGLKDRAMLALCRVMTVLCREMLQLKDELTRRG